MKNILCFLALFVFVGCGSSIKTKKFQDYPHFDKTVLQKYLKIQEKSTKLDSAKIKFYNFDDLLINGQYKKPQMLYTDAKQKVRFERLLKLKKNLLPKLKNTANDPTLR